MRVPVYDSPQVAPQALPGVRAEALVDPAGGAVGQGVQQLGEGMRQAGDQMLEMKDRFDTIAATNAHTQYIHDSNATLHGNQAGAQPPSAVPLVDPATGQPRTVQDAPSGPSQKAVEAAQSGQQGLSPKGLLNERGMAASAYSHPTLDWIAQRRDEIAAGLQNENQRRKFLASSASTLEDAKVTIERHTAQQNQAAQEASVHAATAATINGVANNYFDAASVERQLGALEPSIRKLALSPEDGDAKVAAVRQEAYETVVNQYVADKDWKGAQAAFSQHQSALGYGEQGAEKRTQLEHKITVLRDQQEGERIGSEVVSNARTAAGLTNVPAAIKTFGALPDHARTPEAWEAFHKNLELAERSSRDTVSGKFTGAFSAYLKNHSLSDVDAPSKAWLQTNDPEGWHRLEEIDRQHKRERTGGGEGGGQDIDAGKVLADMAAHSEKYDPKQGGMSYDNLAYSYAKRLGPHAFKEVRKAYAEIQAAAAKGDKDTSVPMTAHNVILELGHPGLWDKEQPAKMTDDSAKAFRYLSTKAEDFRRTFKSQHKGNEPLTEDYEKALAPEFQTVKTPGVIWGTNDVSMVKYQNFKDYRGKDGQLKPLAVPDEFKAALKARKGGDISPQQESQYYLEYLKAGGGKTPAPAPQSSTSQFDHPNVPAALGEQPAPQPFHAHLRPPEPKPKAPVKSPAELARDKAKKNLPQLDLGASIDAATGDVKAGG